MITALIVLIILLHTFSATVLIRDLRAHWPDFLKEPGCIYVQAPVSFVINFFAGLGISDFSICTALYHKTGWAQPRKLPGTLNTQSTLPVLVFAIAYLSGVQVELATLLPMIGAMVLGAYLSPKLTMSLPVWRIRQILAFGLLFAGCAILANKLNLMQWEVQATSLQGFKLFAGIISFFMIGALKAMGVPSFPLSMTATFFLGLHPLVSYPLMMGGGALAAPLVLVRYVKMDGYMRKMTFLGATVGVVGGSIAVFVVKTLNIDFLLWLVVAVVFYAAIDILLTLRRNKQAEATETKAGRP